MYRFTLFFIPLLIFASSLTGTIVAHIELSICKEPEKLAWPGLFTS